MPSSEEIIDYLYFKGLTTIAFSDNYKYDLDRVSSLIQIDCFGCLQILEAVAEAYKDMMDDRMKDNILTLVSYFRFDYTKEHPEERKEVFDIANRIIDYVNKSTMNKAFSFTFNELHIRRNKGPGFVETVRYFPDYWQLVKDEVADDFFVLFSHTEYINDEKFLQLLEKFSVEEFGYASKIASIVTEYPSLLKDETFSRRTRTTLKILEQTIENPKESKDTLGEIEKVKKIARKVGA